MFGGAAVAAEPLQHFTDPPIPALIVRGGAELQRLRAAQDLPNLRHGAHLRFVHVDHPE